MKCSKYKKLIVEFIDERLDDQKNQEVQNHIIVCTACKNDVEKLRSSMELLVSDSILSKELKPPDRFPESVLDRIHNEKTQPISPFNLALCVIATVCLLGFILGLRFYLRSSESEVLTYQSGNASIKTDLPKVVTSRHQIETKFKPVTKENIKSKNIGVKTFVSSNKNEDLHQTKTYISMEILKLLGPTLEIIEGDEQEWEVEI